MCHPSPAHQIDMQTMPIITSLLPRLLAASGLLAAASPAAHADIIVVAPTVSIAGSLTITAPITFTISTPGSVRYFILDDWVTADGDQHRSLTTPAPSFSLNGGAATSLGNDSTFADNLNAAFGSLTPNDGFIYAGSPFAASSGTVTLNAATYSLGAIPGFNPQATQTFTGNMFLADDTGFRLSDIVSAGAVPEPSTYALALVGGAALLGAVRRSRRTTARRA